MSFNRHNSRSSPDYGMLTYLFKNLETTNADAPKIVIDPTLPEANRYKMSLAFDDRERFWYLHLMHYKSETYGMGGFCGQWVCAFTVSAYGYKDIPAWDFSTEIGEGPMRLTDISRVIGRYSYEYLSADYTTRSEWDIYWHIIQNVAPAFRFTFAGLVPHWTLLYGTYRVERWLFTAYYFLEIDNGSLIGAERKDRIPI